MYERQDPNRKQGGQTSDRRQELPAGTFAWILRNRRLRRDYEYLPETTEALIRICMIQPMLERPAKGAA